MSDATHKRVTKTIAEMMLAHYENPMCSPGEWLDEHPSDADYVDELLEEHHSMYHKDLLEFRQDILLEVANLMNVKIKIT